MRRKIWALVLSIFATISVMGCTYIPSTVKTENAVYYAVSNYNMPDMYVVGDPDITFHVSYVLYKRPYTFIQNNKYPVGRKRVNIPLMDHGATVYMNHLPETIKELTEDALQNTGWGIARIGDNADFIITEIIKDFYMYGGYNGFTNEFAGKGPVRNKPYIEILLTVEDQNGNVVLKKDLKWTEYADAFSPLAENGIDGGILIPENLALFFYKNMVRFFASREFVRAIERYAERVPSRDQIVIDDTWSD